MAKKKLSKVLAWTLAAAMAVSPVNLTWASESADMFSDNSENTESVEMSADETDSLQQNEQDTQSIVSVGEENEDSFTSEDSEEVFSAGEQTNGVEENSLKEQIMDGVGTYIVEAGRNLIFAPTEEATYRISTENENDTFVMMLGAKYGVQANGYYTIKTGNGKAYPIRDVAVGTKLIVSKVPAIASISIDNTEELPSVLPAEPVLDFEIPFEIPVTATLEGGKKIEAKYSRYIEGYGWIEVVYKDSNGKFMWNEESGNLNLSRPTETGECTYYFFCGADNEVVSGPYTVTLKSFADLFEANKTIEEDDGIFKVSFDKAAYINNYRSGKCRYNYGFMITPSTNAVYLADYGNISGQLYVNTKDADGNWDKKSFKNAEGFNMEAGKTYYMILETEEALEDKSDELVISPIENTVKSVKWVTDTDEPTKNNIYDIEIKNFGLKVEVIYENGEKEAISWNEESNKLGVLKNDIKVDEKGIPYSHYYFSKNPFASLDFPILIGPLSEVKGTIPEVTLDDDEAKEIARNFNNCNTFKFNASQSGEYVFEIAGKLVGDKANIEPTMLIESNTGEIKRRRSYDFYYNGNGGLSLNEGDTVYIFAGPYDGKINVKVSQESRETIYPAPKGSISVRSNEWKDNSSVENITFTSERAYKDSTTVTVSAESGSDKYNIKKVSYFLTSSEEKLSDDDLDALEDSKWTELTGNTFNLNPGNRYVVYVKIVDGAGSVAYVSSDGIVVDNTAPRITGITNEKKYCSGVSFEVTDDVLLKSVTVDENIVKPDKNGSYIIDKNETELNHTIIAEDMAGNKTVYKITTGTKDGHDTDFEKNPQFVWEIVPGENLGIMETYGAIPKYNARAVFYCNRCEDYTIEKKCNVFNTTVMGTNGSLSLVYTASVEVEGKEFTETKTIWLNKPDKKNNRVLVETNIESNAPKTIIAGVDNNLVEKILTKDEADIYNDVNSRTDVLISPKVNAISEENVTSKEKIDAERELNKIISNMSETPKLSKIEYYDVSLLLSVNFATPRKIEDTRSDITVGLELSKEARNVPTGFDRKFYVIRDHGGNITRLDATRNGDYLNFDTSLFSTYAVAYIDVKASTSSPSYPGTPSYPVTDVTLSQDKADLTKVGETLQLTATVKPSYADNKTITWKSSDEKVATVDKDGKVTAVANGTATITATSADGKHSATADITVKIAPEKLTLTAENKTLTKVGDTLQITAKIEPDNAYDKLIWKSSDERVAIVDVDGKVTAAGNGKAIITATTEDGKLSESVTITVKIPEKPVVNAITGYGNLKARSVTQTNNSIKVEWSRLSGADGYIVYGSQCNGNGKAYKYKKLATITNGKTRTWTHTKLKKATYYKYIVKAYKLVDGKKVITDTSVSVHAVTKGGNYGVAKAVSVTKIGNKKNVTEVILKKGKTAQITAAEVKKDKKIKHHRKLCYESSNPNVATVTAKGMIKAIGKGSCTVWVYAQNGVYKAITVTVK